MIEENEYILGTDEEELNRLELQHKVWLSEAKYGWDLAEFKSGQTILDLGCGPGYCAEELARIVGKMGRVIGVDKSNAFIAHLNQIKQSTTHAPIASSQTVPTRPPPPRVQLQPPTYTSHLISPRLSPLGHQRPPSLSFILDCQQLVAVQLPAY